MARREANVNRNMSELNLHRVEGYHASGWDENYAQAGFGNENEESAALFFASDRAKSLKEIEEALQHGENVPIPKGYGIEVELGTEIYSRLLFETAMSKGFTDLFPAKLWKLQRDGSLEPERRGCVTGEAITQVFAKSWMRNNYRNFKLFWQFMDECGIRPNDSCGMHVNVGLYMFGKDIDTQCRNIAKIHNWIMNNWETALALVHRKPECAAQWSARMPRMTAAQIAEGNGNHHVAMNYSHLYESEITARRVEFRLVGPQKSYPAFRNTMEVIFHLVEQSKKLSAADFNDPSKLWRGANWHVHNRLRDVLPSYILDTIEFNMAERFI